MKQHGVSFRMVGWVMAATVWSFCPYVSAVENEPEMRSQAATKQLEEITVYGEAVSSGFTKPIDVTAPGNNESLTEKSVNLFGNQGNISVFKVVEMSPSVNYSPADSLGTNESGFHDSIRIRGKKQTGPGNLKSYEGIPINGNPGGGKTIFDIENIESVDLYKGYLPVDKGLGLTNLVGKVDMTVKRPQHTFGADFSQTVGTDNFYRTFLRIDSGDIGKVSAF